jgi:hypothetical protein
MAEASSSLKLIREAAAACAVQLSQLFPVDGGLGAHAESAAANAIPLENADSGSEADVVGSSSRQQRLRAEAVEASSSAGSWLQVLENGNHAAIMAYLAQPEKLQVQETCRKLRDKLRSTAAWKDLDLMYAHYKHGNVWRAPPEQLALHRAVIAQPKYSSAYSVCLADSAMGPQSSASSRKSKKQKVMGVESKHLIEALMETLPNVQSLDLQFAYLLGRGSTRVLPVSLIRDSLSNLKYLACSASLTLLQPVLTHCQQLAHLHLNCATAYESQVGSHYNYHTLSESRIIEHLYNV